MADDSPGKVQALRAIFSEKNAPMMCMLPSEKNGNKPWKPHCETTTTTFKQRILSEQKTSKLITKVLPVPTKKDEHIFANGLKNVSREKTANALVKPSIGPKPLFSAHQLCTDSSTDPDNSEVPSQKESRDISDGQLFISSHAKSKVVAETIASFMFTNGHKPSDLNEQCIVNKVDLSCTSTTATQPNSSGTIETKCIKSDPNTLCSMIISSDNYVCKKNCSFRRKNLPSLEVLGPPPQKTTRPLHLKLPTQNHSKKSLSECTEQTFRAVQGNTTFQKPVPSYPCPARPQTPPPLPPTDTNLLQSLRQELEELYEDTILSSEKKRPVSLIPVFTEEEEIEELYNDAAVNELPLPLPPKPPPLPPSEYLKPRLKEFDDELYQDADDIDHDEFYEVMPSENMSDDFSSPLYSNNKKEIEKLRREGEKKVRREQREKEKRDKEMDKLKKKFCLSGDEIPIDDGLVKSDSRGGKSGDLAVKKGETVLILRMEGNPSGRWLVKNEKGKIGYVELTNIEVDPDSVKSAKGAPGNHSCDTPIEKNINWLSKITACVR